VKDLLKLLLNALALVLVLPAFMAYVTGGVILGRERVFPGWSQALSLVPGLTGQYLRRAFYRLALKHSGRNACVSFGTIFSHATAELGDNVYVGAFCCLGDVTLEDDVLLGSHVSVPNGGAQHGIGRLDVPIREQAGTFPRITIGADSWVGDRAIVLANVGRHCVIGAGSVVTQPIPDYAIAVGVPAKVIRYRETTSETLAADTLVADLIER
jgi:acetyltransferase-like isoleucine patch superfamily enzyme